jgi:hypothetical protein
LPQWLPHCLLTADLRIHTYLQAGAVPFAVISVHKLSPNNTRDLGTSLATPSWISGLGGNQGRGRSKHPNLGASIGARAPSPLMLPSASSGATILNRLVLKTRPYQTAGKIPCNRTPWLENAS